MAREDWADLGLRVLAEEGPAGLTVARMCERAALTRGSLYHHFADHDALLRGVLERWVEHYTDRLIATSGDTRELNVMALGLDFRVEQAVRRLVARQPELESIVRAVDERRIRFLEKLHRAHGIRQPREIAEIEYAAFLGFQQLDLPAKRLATLFKRFEQIAGKPRRSAVRSSA